MLTMGGVGGTLGDSERGKALAYEMSMTLEIYLAHYLAYEKPSINVGGVVLRLFGVLNT